MRSFDKHWLTEGVVSNMRRQALTGTFSGRQHEVGRGQYFDSCRAKHVATGTILIFTRDTGHHSGGWWKNPDYERCWHLSLSFRDILTGKAVAYNKKQAAVWTRAFFDWDDRKLWCEPFGVNEPYGSYEGWHYRLFCDEYWQPLIPRGEVYSREFTEIGWKSYSELHDLDPDGEDPLSIYSMKATLAAKSGRRAEE